MVQLTTILGLGVTFAALVAAMPAPAPIEVASLHKRATCTFTNAASASKSKTDCATLVLSGIVVPSGTTLDLTDLNSGTTVIFEGVTDFEYEEWSGPLVSISGTDITISGASGSYLNGNGNLWWDGEGSNGGKTKPKFFYAHNLISSSITGLTFKNTPVQMMSIDDATDLTVTDINQNNLDGNTGDSSTEAASTDAFDVGSSTGVTITGATINNQDDCLAINSGTSITFSNGYCSGGHGLSIGSVGGRDDNTVETIVIESSTVTNSQNGIRIKTISGDTGTVKGVTYKSITLSGITEYGIIVNQAYDGTSGDPTTEVPITDFVLDDISGSVESGAYGLYIECGSGSCSYWTWTSVSLSGSSKSNYCLNAPSSIDC